MGLRAKQNAMPARESDVTPEKSTPLLANPFAKYSGSDTVTIRGRRLAMAELVDPKLFSDDYILKLAEQAKASTPFLHIAEDGWFNPELLELAAEEFDTPDGEWTSWESRYQSTYRSTLNPVLGPASSMYFHIVNSSWFVSFLQLTMGIPDLIVDQQLYGGGLHESRNGGKFGIHRDFERQARTNLLNEMSIITYLNKDWDPAWGGVLELWDKDKLGNVKSIVPEFGRSVVMKHGAGCFHGHPKPLAMPEGRRRRSVSAYYYSNAIPVKAGMRKPVSPTYFLISEPKDVVVETVRNVTPPIIWETIAKIVRSARA
jgi:hypothetical protein